MPGAARVPRGRPGGRPATRPGPPAVTARAARALTLCLCGDVMTGRGVDQILPHPGDPLLAEPSLQDARGYVALAEAASGPIPRPAAFSWIWGDALTVLAEQAPDVRLLNLETSITASGEFSPGKGIHYRMSPANTGCLTAVRPDACVLANNHVLDFGRRGLTGTLRALARAGLTAVGAGRDDDQARRPALLAGDRGRVVVFACGLASAGIPPDWAAAPGRPGVDYLPGLTPAAAGDVTARIRAARQPGDVVVVSLHWGPNWGYEVSQAEARFARWLLDGGADLVYGHSSHHPRPIEVYRGKLILYGCGDFIDDYEGIGGYEQYRDDLRLMYFAAVTPGTGALASLRMMPLQARKMRLQRAGRADTEWLAAVLTRVSRRFGSRVEVTADGTLVLRWPGALLARKAGTAGRH